MMMIMMTHVVSSGCSCCGTCLKPNGEFSDAGKDKFATVFLHQYASSETKSAAGFSICSLTEAA
jgi:hypothetical protein